MVDRGIVLTLYKLRYFRHMIRWGYYDDEEDTKNVLVRCCPCGKGPPVFWKLNWAAALLHLVNTLATLALWAGSDERDQVFILSETYAPWVNITGLNTSTFVNGCPKTNASRTFKISDEFCVERRTEYTSELSLWWLVIAFHFLSFVFQALVMTEWKVRACGRECIRESYISEVDEHGTNVLRMIEYSVSATLMQISIALILGVWERLVIGGVAALTVVTMLCGLVAEQLKYDRLDMAWAAHLTGWFAMAAVWAILGRRFLYTIEMSEEKPPDFVYAIVGVIGILYTGFGTIQLVQLCAADKDARDRKYCQNKCGRGCTLNRGIEMTYCIMSLTSKTFLGWIIFANALGGMAES